ncbi:hypothetical protein BT63DRAFT_426876 [Microthyrium microscopicum]|uniref:Uncharacterized protein n=1 Tax=Microthyrium microscopicum TaxID=703497 RepID=A0A6A6U7U7_9PEZI|nr:hypothetical protein BT63DRAFT_426876 [Microthyrium microscopicum]
MSGKEDALHEDAEDRAAEVEKHKHESIKDKEWKDGLASNSESIIKAEREETKSTDEHIKKLQHDSVKK